MHNLFIIVSRFDPTRFKPMNEKTIKYIIRLYYIYFKFKRDFGEALRAQE
jgi:hypothetical protein